MAHLPGLFYQSVSLPRPTTVFDGHDVGKGGRVMGQKQEGRGFYSLCTFDDAYVADMAPQDQ
jgi:hypothetical protein